MFANYPPPLPCRGKLIVLDGLTSTGKTTQTRLLSKKLSGVGVSHEVISLPRYNIEPYGPIIRRYTEGKLGHADQISPYLASLPYALDRESLRARVFNQLQTGKWFIFTRYIHSNIAYQGAKLRGKERADFINWLLTYEFKSLRLIPENLGILLDLPTDVSLTYADKRGQSGEGRDSHEQSDWFVEEVNNLYRELAAALPHWKIINCLLDRKKMRSEDAIHREIWEVISGLII